MSWVVVNTLHFAAETLPTLVRDLGLHSAPELPQAPSPGSPSLYVQSRLRVIDVSSTSLMATPMPKHDAATEATALRKRRGGGSNAIFHACMPTTARMHAYPQVPGMCG